VLGAQLGVVAVRFDLYDRASNGAADGYERPACEVGSGIKFDNPRATEKARGAPSVERRDHLVLFAFGRIVDDEALELGARDRRLSQPQLYLNLWSIDILPALLPSLVLKD
jgi:hypothetical protein